MYVRAYIHFVGSGECCQLELLTFPRRFFSRLYWQTYSSSMQREHGAWPLHLVRIRWQ
jgi:hypothetical protein